MKIFSKEEKKETTEEGVASVFAPVSRASWDESKKKGMKGEGDLFSSFVLILCMRRNAIGICQSILVDSLRFPSK